MRFYYVGIIFSMVSASEQIILENGQARIHNTQDRSQLEKNITVPDTTIAAAVFIRTSRDVLNSKFSKIFSDQVRKVAADIPMAQRDDIEVHLYKADHDITKFFTAMRSIFDGIGEEKAATCIIFSSDAKSYISQLQQGAAHVQFIPYRIKNPSNITVGFLPKNELYCVVNGKEYLLQ